MARVVSSGGWPSDFGDLPIRISRHGIPSRPSACRNARWILAPQSTVDLCTSAFAAAYWLSSQFRLNQAERVSLMYGLGMNNNGTGLVLAPLAFASYPRDMVPIIFYNLVQHMVAGIVHEAKGRTASVPVKSVERG